MGIAAFWENFSSGLRHCDPVGRSPVQTSLDSQPGLGTQLIGLSMTIRSKIDKRQ